MHSTLSLWNTIAGTAEEETLEWNKAVQVSREREAGRGGEREREKYLSVVNNWMHFNLYSIVYHGIGCYFSWLWFWMSSSSSTSFRLPARETSVLRFLISLTTQSPPTRTYRMNMWSPISFWAHYMLCWHSGCYWSISLLPGHTLFYQSFSIISRTTVNNAACFTGCTSKFNACDLFFESACSVMW